MSDRIAVMRAGRIEQLDESRRLYERPRTRFVGQFLGSCNLLEATVRARRGEELLVETPAGPLRLSAGVEQDTRRPTLSLAIRPEKIAVLPASEAAGENRVAVRVAQLIYIGSETHYVLEAGPVSLTAYAMNAGTGSRAYRIGENAVAYLPPASIIVLED